MSKNKKNKGLLYEELIHQKCNELGLLDKAENGTAGSDNTSPDIVLSLRGQKVPVELKLNSRARFGSTSMSYDEEGFTLDSSSAIPSDDLVISRFAKKESIFDNVLRYFGSDSITFRTTKAKWNEAVEEGIIREARVKFSHYEALVNKFYLAKGVNYLQCGESGLYHLDEDFLGLGTTKFNALTTIEGGLERGGSRLNANKERICYVQIRLTLRIKDLVKSKVSLDDTEFLKSLAI